VNPEEYGIMYRVEDTHWWYLGMARITRAVLNRWYSPGAGLRILDAGCGTGAVMQLLADYGAVTGFDFAAAALHFCRIRGARRLARASIMQLPFLDGQFDLVTSFDVLCERAVPDDVAALREIRRVLAPGGRVVLRLPAYDWLRGQHDRAVHIRHRYTARELAARLADAGLAVDHLSYANTALFPGAAAKRWLERVIPPRDGTSDLTLGVGPFNGLLRGILGAEASWVARTGLPYGLTVVAVGRKA
jgi:SAM-dependent methyltransferase